MNTTPVRSPSQISNFKFQIPQARPRINLQITRDPSGRVRVTIPKQKKPRGEPVKIVPAGSVVIKIYGRKKTGPFTIAWREHAGGPRQRTMRATLDGATTFAKGKAIALANGELARARFSEAQCASYLRCCELLERAEIIKPMELVISEYTEHVPKLPAGVSLEQVIAHYNDTRPADVRNRPSQEILDEMIAIREKDGSSKNTVDDWRSRLPKFVQSFPGPVASITSQQINDWLRKLPVARRTRNNYRGNIGDFLRYAREAGDVPKNWNPMAEVVRVENEPVRIEIFTPEEMLKLLAARVAIEAGNKRAKPFIPFMICNGFCGLRHEELSAPGSPVLDWAQVDLDAPWTIDLPNGKTKTCFGEIHVLQEVARKIGIDRVIKIQPNARAWLKRYVQDSGPVCPIENATNALLETANRAGIKWKDNGLRKSFISYRLAITENIGKVATEAGTSPDRILHNYKKTPKPGQATRYFNIHPMSGDIPQVKFDFYEDLPTEVLEIKFRA